MGIKKRLLKRSPEELEPFFLFRGAGATKIWLLSIPPHKPNINYYKTIVGAVFVKCSPKWL
jgi:hypothetical protein